MLKSLCLESVYDSAEHNIIRDLQIPLLSSSTSYIRGVGFFSSGWLRLATAGLVSFVSNGGKARFITSPELDERDWMAFKKGEEYRRTRILNEAILKSISLLRTMLESDTLNALSWMVADGVLEFKLAVPRQYSHSGVYHDKVGVFEDVQGDIVAIHGSLNDSIQGSVNGEAISVFRSWEFGQEAYVTNHKDRLESLWMDHNSRFSVHSMPEASRLELVKLRTSSHAPYVRPTEIQPLRQILVDEQSKSVKVPLSLHSYQEEAIREWVSHDRIGILEMATGTGKTITAISACVREFERNRKVAVVVLVPYLHLLQQWEDVARRFGFDPVLCSSDNKSWHNIVRGRIGELTLGVRNNVFIIVSQHTAITDRFKRSCSGLPGDITVCIGDEVHGLGSGCMVTGLVTQAKMRLGLSATPQRWFDEEGTQAIYSYFGIPCYEYTLARAIGRFLTPYYYYPLPVQLDDEEKKQYETLSAKIATYLTHMDTLECDYDIIKKLLIQRSRIVTGASAKVLTLLKVLKQWKDEGREVNGVLVYVAPGQHREVLKALSNLGFYVHEFVHTVSRRDRESILKQFADGTIQILVAVKCLDEGVDVPATKEAFILASSTNPKEFIQRRGRKLRKAPNKYKANIYDCIVVPDMSGYCLDATDKSILKREMPRFSEFESSASNEAEARAVMIPILDQSGLLHLLDQKPWDIYNAMNEENFRIEHKE